LESSGKVRVADDPPRIDAPGEHEKKRGEFVRRVLSSLAIVFDAIAMKAAAE
jgi:hypothetical protein